MKSHTWLGLWKELDAATRREVALAAFEDEQISKTAIKALARDARVRRQTVAKWSLEKRADRFAHIRRLPSAQVAAILLMHFHLVRRRLMVIPFLDFLKIPHKDGVITNVEELESPSRSHLMAAMRRLVSVFPRRQVDFFLDVLSCQSSLPVFSDVDEARRMAFPIEPAPRKAPITAGFIASSDAGDMKERVEPEAEEQAVSADSTPRSFTTLDQVLTRTILASVAEVHGALSIDKVEDLVDEVVQLNLDRHQSYFHRGLLTVLTGAEVNLDFPEASEVRRAWYACGMIVGYHRRGGFSDIVSLLGARPALFRALSRPGTGYAERVVSVVFEAFRREGRYGEAARFLSPDVVARTGVDFAIDILSSASALIRARREADARRLLDVLVGALPTLSEDPDLPENFEALLQRRRAHCARLRGDFDGARALLQAQLDVDDDDIRSDVYADLGLIECGLRSLADVRLPAEEAMLGDFAKQFQKGWKLFEESSRIGAGGRSHGDFCIGMSLFAEQKTEEALSYLERAVAGMSADPERYGKYGPLDTARLALAVALAEQTDVARLSYVQDLMGQVFATDFRPPRYLLVRVLTALDLIDGDAALALARKVYASRRAKAIPILVQTSMIRFVPEAIDELLRTAKRRDFSLLKRWDAAMTVLRESHAMRDAGTVESSALVRERASESFDILVELAVDERERSALIALLADKGGPVGSVLEPIDALVVQSTLYEAQGQFANAASKLSEAFHAILDFDDEWALGKAEALLQDIHALGGEEMSTALRPRLTQYREVFERRSQSGLVIPPTINPDELFGLIVIVGGNETQMQQDAYLIEEIKKHWPNITLLFEHTGWNSSWGEQLRKMDGQLERARAVVIMRFVRTMLGRSLRNRCRDLNIPWVACTGSGRASVKRSIDDAILLAWRQHGASGVAP